MKDKKIMKINDRIVLILMSFLLLVWVIGAVAIPLTSSKAYYNYQFKKDNTVEKLNWRYVDDDGNLQEISYDEKDLDLIITQIIDYLSGDTDNLQLYIDDLEVFSNQALNHMKDVKVLYIRGRILCSIAFVLFLLGCLYIFYRYDEIKKICFKYGLISLIIVVSIGLILGCSMLINFRATFVLFHHIIFPDPLKFRDAFFNYNSFYKELPHIYNLLLTEILDSNIFMDAGFIISAVVIINYAVWLGILYLINKQKKIEA